MSNVTNPTPKRVTFRNSPPVQAVIDTKRKEQSLAARMATITDRYAMLLSDVPLISDNERHILCATLCKAVIDHSFIRFLANEIRQVDAGSEAEREFLASRVDIMATGERIALIESMGF